MMCGRTEEPSSKYQSELTLRRKKGMRCKIDVCLGNLTASWK